MKGVNELDLRIMSKLAENQMARYERIAKDLGVVKGTVAYRINRLIKKGIIRGFSYIPDYDTLGLKVSFLGLFVPPDKRLLNEIREVPNVILACGTAGTHSMVVAIVTRDEEEQNRVIGQIRALEPRLKVDSVSTIFHCPLFMNPSRSELFEMLLK